MVIAPAEAETSTSFVVPASDVTAFEERSLTCDARMLIAVLDAEVKRP